MVDVTYNDAMSYCEWLSNKTGWLYRLPSEAEWEFAARGGNLSKGYKYSGSNNLNQVGWYKDNARRQIQKVGKKRANELGIYDMSGNVWEWCKDWYGEYTDIAQTNPTGAASGSIRVLRGGIWSDSAVFCRVAIRGNDDLADLDRDHGFRVVLSQ